MQSDLFELGNKIFEYANKKAEEVATDFIDGLRGVYRDHAEKQPSNTDLVRDTMNFLSLLISYLQIVIFGKEDQEKLERASKLIEDYKKSLDKRQEGHIT